MPHIPLGDDRPTLALRLRETAQALHVSSRTLWQWVKEGRIPHVRVGHTLMFPVAELQQWLATQATGKTTDAIPGTAQPEETRPSKRR